MKTERTEIPVIYLQPGEVCYSNKPLMVSTILGSCISITMFNSKFKFSSICHCLLPSCKEFCGNCHNCGNSYRYVDCTIVKMLEKFEELNIKRQEIEIKIFGGADVIGHPNACGAETVGRKNIKTALETISAEKLKILTSDIGGVNGRKIIFQTGTGDVYLNRLKYIERIGQ